MIYAFVNSDLINKPNTFIWVLSGAMQTFLTAGLFIYFGINLAPRAKKLFGFILYLAYSLIFIGGTYFGVTFFLKEGMSYQLAFEFTQSIVWFAVGYWAFTTDTFQPEKIKSKTKETSKEEEELEQEYGHIIDNEYDDEWLDLPRKQRLIEAKKHIEKTAKELTDSLF